MARRCTVCEHPEAKKINKMLLSGTKTLQEIADQYPEDLTTQKLYRHRKAHLKYGKQQKVKVVKLQVIEKKGETYAIRSGLHLLEELDTLIGQAKKIYADAMMAYDDPPEPGEGQDGGFTWNDVVRLAKQMNTNRRDALYAIKQTNDLLGRYGDFIRLANDLKMPDAKETDTPLPAEVEEILKEMEG